MMMNYLHNNSKFDSRTNICPADNSYAFSKERKWGPQ